MSNYCIGDTHFGHKNALSFDSRPFKTIEEHDAALIENHNRAVGLTDDVWYLGDFSWHNATKTLEILDQLNGTKHLIIGNHDGRLLKNRDIQKRFAEITDYKELDIGNGKCLVLCHYPIPCFKNHFYGWIHFYAHVHSSFEDNMMLRCRYEMEELYDTPCEMYNVGTMMPWMDYTPRMIDEVIDGWYENHKEFKRKGE